jgi:orotate phosphoribosyltransferase
LSEREVIEQLETSGALTKGHFRLSSGLHSDTYIQCALLLEDPRTAVEIGKSIALKVEKGADMVLSPALGGIIVGLTTALALGCPMIFAERIAGHMEIRRDFSIEGGTRVLLVEDVITTGGSVLELARIVEEAGASVTGIACIVDRGGFDPGGYPFSSLVRIEVDSYRQEDCPLCRAGSGIVVPGSRHA